MFSASPVTLEPMNTSPVTLKTLHTILASKRIAKPEIISQTKSSINLHHASIFNPHTIIQELNLEQLHYQNITQEEKLKFYATLVSPSVPFQAPHDGFFLFQTTLVYSVPFDAPIQNGACIFTPVVVKDLKTEEFQECVSFAPPTPFTCNNGAISFAQTTIVQLKKNDMIKWELVAYDGNGNVLDTDLYPVDKVHARWVIHDLGESDNT